MAVLLAPGCSGSSFVFDVLKVLIGRHGWNVWSPGKEWFNPEAERFESVRNFCTDSAGFVHSWPRTPLGRLRMANRVLTRHLECNELERMKDDTKPTMFFMVGTIVPHRELMDIYGFLHQEGASVAAMRRANSLKRFVCEVKDCFYKGDPATFPVDASGARSDLCFARRKAHAGDADYMANLNAGRIASQVENWDAFWHRTPGQRMLTRTGFVDMKTADMEQLSGFEYSKDESAMRTAVDAFADLLQGLGVKRADHVIIRNHLEEILVKNHGLRTHHSVKEEIYNYEAVEEALSGTPHAWMLDAA